MSILNAVNIKIVVFWDVIACRHMVGDQHFGGPYCPHFQDGVQLYIALKEKWTSRSPAFMKVELVKNEIRIFAYFNVTLTRITFNK